MNRRKFLVGAGSVAVATIVPSPRASLPPFVFRTTVAAHAVYGASPAMQALADMKALDAARVAWLQNWQEVADLIMPRRQIVSRETA